jgi:tetratricopeptide (TPR) repeat protein
MRKTAHALALALAVQALGLLVGLPLARASETRARVDEANAALAREPPDVAAARAALARAATAGDDAEATGEADFLLGKLDEEQGAFEQAVDDYRRAIAAAPNTRWALRATERIDWLHARSEDHFAPLAALEQVRRDPRRAADPASVEALARQVDAFPPGLVRVEARMLVAEAWLGRMHRPDLAVAQLRAVCEDPKADTLTVRLAERELVDVLVTTGRIDEAATEAHDHANRLDARFVRQVTRLLVRRKVRFVALSILAGFALLAGVGFARAARRGNLGVAGRELRKIAFPAAIFVGVVAVGGGALASNYESGNSAPFLLLGGAVLPLVLVARAWAAVGSDTTGARIARSLLAAAATLATAFLLLDTAHPEYLAGFGL